MKNKSKVIILAIICVFAMSAIMCVASAQTGGTAQYGQVIATDSASSNTQVLQYAQGENIYLKYSIQPGENATLTVIDDNTGLPVAGDTWSGLSDNGTIVIQLNPGVYEADLNGERVTSLGVASIFVTPEYEFGALAALGAGIAAFGVIKMKRII